MSQTWDSILYMGTGPTGSTGPSGPTFSYASFYALMPTDNSTGIVQDAAIAFPRADVSSGTDISANIDGTIFTLVSVGIYSIYFNTSITEAAQLVITLNGTQQPQTVVGRATGTSLLGGQFLIRTTTANSTISIINPIATTLTLTSYAGGVAIAVSANLIISRIS